MIHRHTFTKLTAFALAVISILLCFTGCPFSKPKINGVSIYKYTIVYSSDALDYNKRAAEYIQARVGELSGAKMDIRTDDEGPFEHEIVVGETSRPISAALDAKREGLQFAIMADENHIALEGDYFIIAAAAFYFVRTYIESASGEAEVAREALVREPIVERARNFIMLIGDGMGEAQTKLFDAFDAPTSGTEAYSDGEDFFYGYLFPYIGKSRTESLDGVTDSAAGGTALASGYKTHNEFIGRDKDGNDVKLLTELAAELGMASAVMSTEVSTGATPSTFSAHAPNRDDKTAITQAQYEFTKNNGTVIDCGYDYYTANQMKILDNHINATLGKVAEDDGGFFLMYEEAHIDKKCHNNDAESTFLALMRFNQAIGRFMEFAFYNPDTLILITADHETGGLSIVDGECYYSTEEHTSTPVPVFAYGVGAEVFDGVEVENTQIAKTFAALMGVKDFGDPATAPALIK